MGLEAGNGYGKGVRGEIPGGVRSKKGRCGMEENKRPPSTSGRKFKVLLIEEPEGGYSVEVPELPGCFTEGDSLQEALANAREAIECYLDPSAPPQPRNVLIEEIEV